MPKMTQRQFVRREINQALATQKRTAHATRLADDDMTDEDTADDDMTDEDMADEEVTDEQIQDLRQEAVSARDHAQALLCDLALGHVELDEDTSIDSLRIACFLSPYDKRRIAAIDPSDYREACAQALHHARMRHAQRPRGSHATIPTKKASGTRGAPHTSGRAPKTKIVHVIQGNYGYGRGWEDVTAANDRNEALTRLREYRENEPGVPFRRIQRRERIATTATASHTRKKTAPPQPLASSHARKKKLDPHEAKQRLKAAGINFSSDFHTLPSSQKQLLVDTARAAGYRKRKDAPGSTARMYFQYLSRIR